MATTVLLNDSDQEALRLLADRDTGGNQAAALRSAVRAALTPDARQRRTAELVERYEHLLRSQYRELRRTFTEPELMILATARQGWLVTPVDIDLIGQEVEDMAPEDLAAVGLDDAGRAALLAKLAGMPAVMHHALIHALEVAMDRGRAGAPVRWADVLGGQLRGGPAGN